MTAHTLFPRNAPFEIVVSVRGLSKTRRLCPLRGFPDKLQRRPRPGDEVVAPVGGGVLYLPPSRWVCGLERFFLARSSVVYKANETRSIRWKKNTVDLGYDEYCLQRKSLAWDEDILWRDIFFFFWGGAE